MHFFLNILCAHYLLFFLGSEVECLISLPSDTILSAFNLLGFNKESSAETWLKRFDIEGSAVVEYVKFLVEEKYTEYSARKREEPELPEYEKEETPIVMLVTFGATTGKFLDAAKKLRQIGYFDITLYYIIDHFNIKDMASFACQSIVNTLPRAVTSLRYTEKSTDAVQREYDNLKDRLAKSKGKHQLMIAQELYEKIYTASQDENSDRNSSFSLLDYAYERNELADFGSGKCVTELDDNILKSASIVVDALISSEHFISKTMKNGVLQLQKTAHKKQICISNEAPSIVNNVGGWEMLEQFGRGIVISTGWFKPDSNRNLMKVKYSLLFFKVPLSEEKILANPEKTTFFKALEFIFAQNDTTPNEETQAQLIKMLQMEQEGKKFAEFSAEEVTQ